MNDESKSKKQLIEELNELRVRIDALENHERHQMLDREYETGHSNLIENIPGLFFYRHNADGVFTYASSSITKVLGYTPDEFLTHFSEYLTSNPCNSEVHKYSNLSIKGIQQPPYEVQIFHKNGSIRWLEISEIPSTNDQKTAVMVEGIAYDITVRKNAEEALRESEYRYRELVEKCPDAIGMVDMEGNYLSCNSAYAEMLGYSIEELRKLNFANLTPEKWRKWEMEEIVEKQIIARGYSDVYEKEYIKKDGTIFPVELRSHLMRDKDGNPIALWGFIRDITERKIIEENIKQTQKMEAVGTLAGGIAHDFNNILSAIVGYADLAHDEISQDSHVQEYLVCILKSADRAKDLVKQILTFSRKSQEERKPILFHPIVKEVAKLIRSTIPTTIEIRQHIDETIGMVDGDPTQMHQIVMNLCANAAHAMPEAEGVLDIKLSSVVITQESKTNYHDIGPGPFLELKISDTGTGIDSKIIHRIFEPFFTTKVKEKGTGMGLAVVHGIVKDHGGDISIDSQLGKGTTFTILLPQVVAVPDNAEDPISETPTGHEHILFVDDEKTLLGLGKRLLESLGYTVTAQNSSLEAFETFQQSPDTFDMVITDQTMPHMTGYNLAKRILEIKPTVPVILCTGYSETVSPEKAEASGIKALVYKPVSKKEIAQKIRKVLDNKNA